MAPDFGICISSSKVVSSVQEAFVSSFATKGLLVFASSVPESLSITLDGNYGDSGFIFAGMEGVPEVVFTRQTRSFETENVSVPVFFALEVVNITDDLQADFESRLSAKDSSLAFLEAVLTCPSFLETSCQSQLDSYFNRTARHRDVRRGLDGFQAAFDVIQLLQGHNCGDLNFHACGLSLHHMNLSSSPNNSRVQSQICAEDIALSLEVLDQNGTLSTVCET